MRRRILTTATAILALGAAPALAMDMDAMAAGPSLSLSGSAGLGATFEGEVKDGTKVIEKSQITFNHFAKVTFAGEGVTDGGLTFGMKVRVNTSKVDDGEIHIGGEMWKLTVGDNDSASDLAFALPDVGFDGNLGVDDIAEKAHKRPGDYNDSEARVDLTFGVATIAVSVGQTPGSEYKPMVAGRDARYRHYIMFDANTKAGDGSANVDMKTEVFYTKTNPTSSQEVNALADLATLNLVQTPEPTAAAVTPVGFAGNDYYIVGNSLYKVVGNPDKWVDPAGNAGPSAAVGDDVGTGDDKKADTLDEKVIDSIDLNNTTDITVVPASTVYQPAVELVKATPATKQETNWSAGTSVDLGVAKLGFGLDSEKKMSVSVSGSFGTVGGGLYYSQQDVEMVDAAGTVVREDKWTGLGAQVNVDVGDGTTVTVVGAQQDRDTMGKRDAFGVGVTHALGGGATVEAGFAQVNDQNKASAGVTMSF